MDRKPQLACVFQLWLALLGLAWLGGGFVVGVPVDAAPGTVQSTPTPTTVPFLQPPFAGMYRVTSYFDHHFPTYEWDDTIVVFDGKRASAIDGIVDRTATFRGGYWFPDTSRYIYYDGHNGFDYGTGAGKTILAAAPGEVVFAGSVPSGCATPLQFVRIRHENGYATSYLHLKGICVREGEWVEAGDPLGISGNSGCSLGPHLHFAVQHGDSYTDPYGWQPADEPDPLIAHAGAPATWLWGPDQPPLPSGTLVHPAGHARTNGDLCMSFVPDGDSPPVGRVVFLAYYGRRWHQLGVDDDGGDGWSFIWDTRNAPQGTVWLHAWAVGTDGRVGKGSPIRADVTVDRTPPEGLIVGLLPGSTAGAPLWLYAASYDPTSTTARVTFLIREGQDGEWREIGDATWLHTSNWLLQWDAAGIADGTQIDVVARLVDGAGNATRTEAIEGVTIDRRMPGGDLLLPMSGTPFTTTLNLVFAPLAASGASPSTAPVSQVAFYVWHDGDWHAAGVDRDGRDGWAVRWDPAGIIDQPRVRVQARVYDAEGRVNTALPQVTDLTLDRTPPRVGYIRPAAGGVARPEVDYRVWAWDEGSGVERVEFTVNAGEGWLKIGEDRDAEDGWSLLWDARGIPDGIVQFGARAFDRAGNDRWADPVPNVALDRAPPVGRFAFPAPGMRLGGTITLTLDVTDTVSRLDRAIFYAGYDGHWHHLGADQESDDGFHVAWDAAPLGARDDVSLTAWVYDRAGNHAELPHVEGLALSGEGPIAGAPSSAIVPTPTMTLPSPTPALPAAPTPTPTPRMEKYTMLPTATNPPSPPPTQAPTATPYPAVTAPVQTMPPATGTPFSQATPMPVGVGLRAHPPPPSSPSPWPVPRAFWYLIAAGAMVALALLLLSLHSARTES